MRTNSRLETTFDSNCGVTTAEVSVQSATGGGGGGASSSLPESNLEGIRPMEPIVPLVPPPYNVVIRNGTTYRHNSAYPPGARNG